MADGLFSTGESPRYGPEAAAAVKRTADFVASMAMPVPVGVARNETARTYSYINEPAVPLFDGTRLDPFKFEFPKIAPGWGEPDRPSLSPTEPESVTKRFMREVRSTWEDSKNVLANREFLMQLRDAEATGNYPITGYKNVYPRAPGLLLGLATTQWNRDVLPAAKLVGSVAAASTLAITPGITPFAAAVPQTINRIGDAARDAALARAADGHATYSQAQLLEKYGASMAESGGRPDYVGATLEAIYDTAMGSGGTAPMLIGTALNSAEAASIVYESRLLGSLANDRLGEHRHNGVVDTATRAGVAGVSVLGGATTDWWFPQVVAKLPVGARAALSSLPSKAVDVAGAATGAAVGNYIDAKLRASDYSRWAPAMEEVRDRNHSVYGHPVLW